MVTFHPIPFIPPFYRSFIFSSSSSSPPPHNLLSFMSITSRLVIYPSTFSMTYLLPAICVWRLPSDWSFCGWWVFNIDNWVRRRVFASQHQYWIALAGAIPYFENTTNYFIQCRAATRCLKIIYTVQTFTKRVRQSCKFFQHAFLLFWYSGAVWYFFAHCFICKYSVSWKLNK